MNTTDPNSNKKQTQKLSFMDDRCWVNKSMQHHIQKDTKMRKHEEILVLSCKSHYLGSYTSKKSSWFLHWFKNQVDLPLSCCKVNPNKYPTRWASKCSISIPEHTQRVSKSLALSCYYKKGNLIPHSLFHYLVLWKALHEVLGNTRPPHAPESIFSQESPCAFLVSFTSLSLQSSSPFFFYKLSLYLWYIVFHYTIH